ncbi:hypothetical protein PHYPSEUDO_008264 [Phytophthora pseudosyringae]|uniref:DDE-1 domain-containing protein n=1 Tax=Phytophthora pseudosyringae TaxID=221518 RepID=A0A8T1VHR5_9STRA|nr:hypothetical protein PHYPSEUDO_008264 [Phytophthora pseudosyringae]
MIDGSTPTELMGACLCSNAPAQSPGQSGSEIKAPSRDDVVGWVASAWGELSDSTISNGFNGILAAPPIDSTFEASSNALAEQLERMQLLDPEFGEVGDEEDIVDMTIR